MKQLLPLWKRSDAEMTANAALTTEKTAEIAAFCFNLQIRFPDL